MNLWDEAKDLGIDIDIEQLEKKLKIPVTPIVALTGEGIKLLVSKIKQAKSKKTIKTLEDDEKWSEIGKIVSKVEKIEHKHHTLSEKLSDLTIRPHTGIPIAIGIIFCAFWFVRLICENLISYLFDPFFEKIYLPLIIRLSELLGPDNTYNINWGVWIRN